MDTINKKGRFPFYDADSYMFHLKSNSMKKIYLSWVFLFCCLYAQSISLRGLTTVTPGANYVYYLDLGNITKTTSYKVYCSTNGILTQYNDIKGR